MKTNVLYFGDNLEILRNLEYFPENSRSARRGGTITNGIVIKKKY
jgi:hypothetical protein